MCNFTRDEYRVMIDAGINLYVVDPEQSQWIRGENVFYLRGAGGNPPLAYPADLYRSNYLGPVMFMDEPAIIMVGDKNVHTTLRYFSDAANLLEQRIRFRYSSPGSYSAFALETRVSEGRRALRRHAAGTVRLSSVGDDLLDRPLSARSGTGRHRPRRPLSAGRIRRGPGQMGQARKHTPEQMLRYHYAILRGAARANAKDWGMSIYGQAEEKYSPLAVTLAYDMERATSGSGPATTSITCRGTSSSRLARNSESNTRPSTRGVRSTASRPCSIRPS